MSDRFFLTWIVLTLATLLSWWLDVAVNGAWIGTAVLLIAFFKARMVLMIFMEVKGAPAALRWCCEAWVIVACMAVISTYWLAPLA
jgi:hypothetical protein